MRLRNLRYPVACAARPFAGQGLSVYVSTTLPIRYRNHALRNSMTGVMGLQGNTGARSTRVAAISGESGDALELPIDLSAHAPGTVYIDVRHYRDDVESLVESPVKVVLSEEGTAAFDLSGTVKLLTPEIQAGGRIRFQFRWAPGVTVPTQFRLRRTAGPTTPNDILLPGGIAGLYEIITGPLEHGGAYTYRLLAERGSSSTIIAADINVTPDAEGPPEPTSITVRVV